MAEKTKTNVVKKATNKKRTSIKKRAKSIKPISKFKKRLRTTLYSPSRSPLWFRFLLITIAALIVTFAVKYFVHSTGIYTGGLRSVQQIIFYATRGTLPEWSTYLIFFGMNIPLAYFGWKYIGPYFTILTLYFLLIQSAFELMFDNVDVFSNLHIVGPQNMSVIDLSATASSVTGDVDKALIHSSISGDTYIAGALGGVIYGLGVSLAYVAGGSSGGTKFIVAWINQKYNKSLGKVSIYVAIFIISLGLIINKVILQEDNFIATFISPIAIASAILVLIQGIVQTKFAPRIIRVQILIHTARIAPVQKVIDSTILSKRLWYTFKIKKNKNKRESSVIALTVDKRESAFILHKLTRALPTTFITYHEIKVASKGFASRGFD